jgi:hypothetical protein
MIWSRQILARVLCVCKSSRTVGIRLPLTYAGQLGINLQQENISVLPCFGRDTRMEYLIEGNNLRNESGRTF